MLELIIGGAQIVGRAFTRAVREEFRTSQQAAERAGGGRQGARRVANDSITGMTLQVHFMLKSYKKIQIKLCNCSMLCKSINANM